MDITKLSIHNMCNCSCHIKGKNIMHCAPCCKLTYVKYLIQDEDGNITFDPHTTIDLVINSNSEKLR